MIEGRRKRLKRMLYTYRTIGLVIAFLIFIVDRAMKVLTNLGQLRGHIGTLQLTRLHNFGAMGGSLIHQRLLLAIVGIVVLVTLAFMWFRYATGKFLVVFFIGWGLVFGGALGNTYDRVRYGYVTDMLQFQNSHGVFNLADVSLQVGGIIVLSHFFMQLRQERSVRR